MNQPRRLPKLGLFIHWGLHNRTGQDEWAMYEGRIPVRDYEQAAAQYHPGRFHAEEWVQAAQAAGIEYIIVHAKCFDGFSMFDSPVNPFSIARTTGRDLLLELADACKQARLPLGISYAHARDWHHPMAQSLEMTSSPHQYKNLGNFWDYPMEHLKNLQKYLDDLVLPELDQLTSQYGELLAVRFDAPSLIRPDQAARIRGLIAARQPDCLVNNRLCTGETGDYISMEQLPFCRPSVPWELHTPLIWPDMIPCLTSVLHHDGSLLMDVYPNPDGSMPEQARLSLRRLGAWLRRCGEAVYSAHSSPFPTVPSWGGVTQRDHTLCLLAADPALREITLHGLTNRILSCTALETGRPLPFTEWHDDQTGLSSLSVRLTGMISSLRTVRLETEGLPSVAPFLTPDMNGTISLPAAQAEVIAQGGLHISPFGVTEGWTDPHDCLRWQFVIDRPGRYALCLLVSASSSGLWEIGHEAAIELDDRLYSLTIGEEAMRRSPHRLSIAQVHLTPGRHTAAILPELILRTAHAGLTLEGMQLIPSLPSETS